MNRTMVALASFMSVGSSLACGEDAHFLDREADAGARSLWSSESTGSPALVAELDEIVREAGQPGWDGSEAAPVTPAAAGTTLRLLSAMPLDLPLPSLAPDPQGAVSLEWRSGRRRMITLSVDASGVIHWAALVGAAVRHGSEPFVGPFPKVLADFIREVMSK